MTQLYPHRYSAAGFFIEREMRAVSYLALKAKVRPVLNSKTLGSIRRMSQETFS